MRDKSLDLAFSQKNLTEQKEGLKQLSNELADKEEIISSERKEKRNRRNDHGNGTDYRETQ
jgi:hypothetical protein